MAMRTFVALPLDEGTLNRIQAAQRDLAQVDGDVRWTERENLHIALKFLGQVEDVQINEICHVVAAIAGEVEAFDFSIEGLTATPTEGQLRMIWANIVDPDGGLAELNGRMEDAFGQMGFKQEHRQFHPHLTVGRVKSGKNVAALRVQTAEYKDKVFGVQGAGEVIVFSSQLTPQGPIYAPMYTADLG